MKKITEDEENKEVDAKHLISLTREQYNHLQECSAMLSQIGGYVEDFCKGDEDTTLNAVIRLKAEYHNLLSEYHYNILERDK